MRLGARSICRVLAFVAICFMTYHFLCQSSLDSPLQKFAEINEQIEIKTATKVSTTPDFSLYDPSDIPDDPIQASEFRANHLWRNCVKLGMTNQSFPLYKSLNDKKSHTVLLVAEKYKLITCSMFKVGSTHWRKLFHVAGGVYPDMGFELDADEKLPLVRYMKEAEANRALAEFKKVIVYRDPLERLISFYRDKLLPPKPGYMSKMHATSNKIKYAMRYDPKYSKSYKTPLTFEHLLAYIVRDRVNRMMEYWEVMHWESHVSCCNPCKVHYNHLMSMDHVTEEANVLLSALGLPPAARYPAAYNSSGPSKQELFAQYYSQIPPDLYKQICDYYATDYKLFGHKCPDQPTGFP